MIDKPTRSEWETLAARESKGRDLSRETFEGIRLDNVYGPDAAIDSGHCTARSTVSHETAVPV